MVNSYRALVEHSADAIWMVGESGRIEFASPASRALLGYSPDELTGADAFAFFLPSDRERARERIFGPESGSATFRLRRKDGQTVWVDAAGANRLADSDVAAVIVSLRDVTEARRAEQALRDSESRFRALVGNSADGFVLLDRQGTVVLTGPPVLGYAASEFVGRSVLEVIHPDDLERLCADLASVAARPDKPFHAEYRARHAGGGERWIEATFRNLLTDPAVSGIVVNYRDITERRRREDELRRTRDQLQHILGSIRESFLALDREWRFTFVNPRIASATGKSPEQLLGHNIWEVFPEAKQTEYYPQYRRVMTERVPVQFELYYPSNGMWFDVHAYPTEEGLTAYVLDITARKRTEQSAAVQLEVMRALLESRDVAELAPRILRAVGENLGWASGTFWAIDGSRLRASETWRSGKARRGKATDTLARQALESGGAVSDGSGAAFPIRRGEETVGVLEWIAADRIDEALLPLLETIAAQIGSALDRS
jgi:PAS domain S-box-containing protein